MFVATLVFWWLSIASIPWLLSLSSFATGSEWPFVFRLVAAVSALSLPCLVLPYLAVTCCFATVFSSFSFPGFSV